MASPIGHIAQLLDATLDSQTVKKAEKALKEEEKQPGYAITLLQIVASDALPIKTRHAASLQFKTFIRNNYVDENGAYKISVEEVKTIKQELIALMITCPPLIQSQLGESISIIADSDFWKRWDTLVPDLVNRLSKTDYKVNNGVLEVAHSIFVRWRPLFRSNELYEEINHVLNAFGAPFLTILDTTDKQIESNKDNATNLKGWFETLSLLVRIFYDLSCQDLPPVFEEHLGVLASLFNKYLSYSNPVIATEDDDEAEASPVETVKADICEALQLYTTKYDDVFGNYVQGLTSTAWNLLTTTGTQKKYDLLVSKALNFLTAVASVQQHAQIFNNENVLQQVVSGVVVPNVMLRDSDIEMFEDEPIEFIRRDLEGSDTDSRRKAATDFLRKLLEKFEAPVTNVVFARIDQYLVEGQTNWKAKDTAVYLFIAVAAKGAVTAAQGIKTVNQYVDVIAFFEKNIAQDLLGDSGVHPIAKVDAIKFLHNFRSQLTKEQWSSAMTPLMTNLQSQNYVVYTYAAIALERVLYLTNDAGQHIITREDIQPIAQELLNHLFQLIKKDKQPVKVQENEFLMRCAMRVLIVIKDGAAGFLDGVLNHLIEIMDAIKANPANPRFYYYHFEAIGALVRFCSATSGSTLETRLWQPFSAILQEQVDEFIPFVLQIYATLVEAQPQAILSTNMKSLIGPLTEPAVWETRGNVPGCVRFLSAAVPKSTDVILSNNLLEKILGIIQRLIQGKKSEQNGFDLLEAVVIAFNADVIDQYFTAILGNVLTKLQANPSDSYKLRFCRFYHLVSSHVERGLGTDFFIKHIKALQEDIWVPIYLQIILPTTAQFARPADRKLAVISFAKTLCDSVAFAEQYAKGWRFTCENMLGQLKNPPQVSGGFGDDIINEADVDDIGFGLGYTPLNTCKPGVRDDFPDITNVQTWVGTFMKQANMRRNGAVERFITERLPEEAQKALTPYLQ